MKALLLLTLAACAVEPMTASVEQPSTIYCNAPLYTWCHPYYWGGDQDTCQRACNASNGVYGQCPEYDAGEISYCLTWWNVTAPNGMVYCVDGEPRFLHRCEAGLVSLTDGDLH